MFEIVFLPGIMAFVFALVMQCIALPRASLVIFASVHSMILLICFFAIRPSNYVNDAGSWGLEYFLDAVLATNLFVSWLLSLGTGYAILQRRQKEPMT